jgi:hypothetical protein
MNTALSTTKTASLLATLTAAVGLSLGSAGCLITTGDGTVVTTDPGPEPTPAVVQETIDTGATMTSTPGQGVGVFVQYAQGGHWTVFTTCDTTLSGDNCGFDVLVSALPNGTTLPGTTNGVAQQQGITNVQGQNLEAGDAVTLNEDGSVDLTATTTFGTDGMSFDAAPGQTIEINVLLDGQDAQDFVFAVSNGALLNGVPTNPVDFTPGTP